MELPPSDDRTPADPLGATLAFQLRRAGVAVATGLARVLEPAGLRVGEAYLLRAISADPGCTQSDIARAHHMQPANLVPLIARLEAIGAVERAHGRGRAIGLTLSPEGEALSACVAELLDGYEARITRFLAEGEREALLGALSRVAAAACDA